MSQLTHINAAGEAHMVDVSAKAETVREARAEAFVTMRSETLAMIIDGRHHKGDVFATARIAGIQAAKRTWDLIPLCHPLMLSKVEVNLQAEPEDFPTVEALRQHMAAQSDRWALALEDGKLLAAVNQTLVSFDHPLTDGDEVAFFPPVTGG